MPSVTIQTTRGGCKGVPLSAVPIASRSAVIPRGRTIAGVTASWPSGVPSAQGTSMRSSNVTSRAVMEAACGKVRCSMRKRLRPSTVAACNGPMDPLLSTMSSSRVATATSVAVIFLPINAGAPIGGDGSQSSIVQFPKSREPMTTSAGGMVRPPKITEFEFEGDGCQISWISCISIFTTSLPFV